MPTFRPNGPGKFILTFDNKDFPLGLSPFQQAQNMTGGTFATATAIDVYRYPGLLCPGPLPTAATGTVSGTPYTFQFLDNDSFFGSFLLTSSYLYNINQFNQVQTTQSFAVFTGSLSHQLGTFPTETITVSHPHSIIKVSNVNPYTTDYNGDHNGSEMIYFTDLDIGYYLHSTSGTANTFIDTWGSGTGATSSVINGVHIPNITGSFAMQNAIHRAVAYNHWIVFTNGTYIGKIDTTTQSSTSTYYTVDTNAFELPVGFQARDIRVENGLLQILCDDGYGDSVNPSRVWLVTWDGVNPLAQDIIELDDNMGLASTNINGFPVAITKGRGMGTAIRKKDFWGWPQVQFLPTSSLGTRDVFPSLINTITGQVAIGSTGGNSVYLYGSPFTTYSYRGSSTSGQFPDVLTSPIVTTGTSLKCFGPGQGTFLTASVTGSTNYVESFPLNSYTSYNNPKAQFQLNFTELPNKCHIDWIKFSILPLTGNEAFTPQLYVDGNTTPITLDNGDLTSTTLDADTNAKTYTDIGRFATSLAIGGNWANSTTNSSTVIISQIDVGLSLT